MNCMDQKQWKVSEIRWRHCWCFTSHPAVCGSNWLSCRAKKSAHVWGDHVKAAQNMCTHTRFETQLPCAWLCPLSLALSVYLTLRSMSRTEAGAGHVDSRVDTKLKGLLAVSPNTSRHRAPDSFINPGIQELQVTARPHCMFTTEEKSWHRIE